ncbi:MAG: helix-hairpin-helix domain-containing protein [Gammaproteobacteria bacterium]|nr:helix-hairpin-helix domain-containing protein [Gammaproteobacteria bacterium]
MIKTIPVTHRNAALKDLQRISGVGPSIANNLCGPRITAVQDLRNSNPKALYAELCVQAGQPVGRCVLSVFCCAIWFADHSPAPEKLTWWNWKDST